MHVDNLAALCSRLEGDRSGIQISDELVEDGLQVWVGRIAVKVNGTPMEEGIKGPDSCLREAREKIVLRGESQIEDNAAQIGGKQAHHGESQSCTIGNTFQVHLLIAKRSYQIMHISSVFERRKGVQVDARLDEAVMAGTEILAIQAAE